MKLRFSGLVAVTVAVAFSPWVFKPQADRASHKSSDLRVTIVPEKKALSLHETLNTQVEFKNLGTKTYCFPKPSLDCTNDYPGSAVTTARPQVSSVDREQFICHFDAGGPPRGLNASGIKQNWVVLAPDGMYLTDAVAAKVDLDVLGEWRLETTYWQPQGAFHPVAVKKHLESLTESAGCTLPTGPIKSEPVTIQVVAVTKD